MSTYTTPQTAHAGQTVGVAGRHSYTLHTIERVTQTGIIVLDNGWRFCKYGQQQKSASCQYPSRCLVTVARAVEHNAAEQAKREAHRAVQALNTALAGRKNGLGDYNLTPAQVAALVALAADIATDTTAEVATEVVAADYAAAL
jgi:hypothetical protein